MRQRFTCRYTYSILIWFRRPHETHIYLNDNCRFGERSTNWLPIGLFAFDWHSFMFYVPSTVLAQEDWNICIFLCCYVYMHGGSHDRLRQIWPGPNKQIVQQSNMIQTIVFHPFFMFPHNISSPKHTQNEQQNSCWCNGSI